MTPTSDLVERLREYAEYGQDTHMPDLALEAASHIEALAAEVSRLRERERVLGEALRPFAGLWIEADQHQRPSNPFYKRNEAVATYGDLRRALAAVEQ